MWHEIVYESHIYTNIYKLQILIVLPVMNTRKDIKADLAFENSTS